MDVLNFDQPKYETNIGINFVANSNLNGICRICLGSQENGKMCNIFEGAKPLACIIMLCAAVQANHGDGLPNTICQKCLVKLNVAWDFKMQCESSDSKLRQYFSSSSIIQLVDDPRKDFQCNFELPNVAYTNLYSSETNSSVEVEVSKSDKVTTSKKKVKQKIEKAKEAKIHQCETCGKIFNRREYLTQHIRIHTGEKPYRCHLCEKRFVNSGHLTTHMRTHTGDKPHRCSLCPKAFSTKQELNKHTMVHKGIRPFECNTCGKRFGSSSNLYSHLKHHTGEKNFTCEQCGKHFYTKQELKQHYVIHTGEKAFLCEFCNKRFSQIAHLKRHLKLHS